MPDGYTLLKEGQATILQHGNDVFYNPAQVDGPMKPALLGAPSLPVLATGQIILVGLRCGPLLLVTQLIKHDGCALPGPMSAA